jgi:hypothetical protein
MAGGCNTHAAAREDAEAQQASAGAHRSCTPRGCAAAAAPGEARRHRREKVLEDASAAVGGRGWRPGRDEPRVPVRERLRRFRVGRSLLLLGLLCAYRVDAQASIKPVIIPPTPGNDLVFEFDHTIQIGEEISFTFALRTKAPIINQPLGSVPPLSQKFDPFIWRKQEDYYPQIVVDDDPGMPNAAVITPLGDMKVTTFLDPGNNMCKSSKVL